MSDSKTYRTTTARIVEQNNWLAGFILLWAVLLGVLGGIGNPAASGALASILFLGPLFFFMGMRSNAVQSRGSADGRVLECSREGVFVDGKLLIARSAVDNGAAVPDTREGGMLVQLGKKGSINTAHTLHARDAAEAQAILSALELDVKHSTLVHREAGWMAYSTAPSKLLGAAFGLGILAFIPLLVLLNGSALAAVLPALGMMAFFGPLWGTRSQITVGADGVLASWMGKERFCPYAEVARFERTATGGILHKRDGSQFPVVVSAMLGQKPLANLDRATVVGRIEDALRLYQTGALAPGAVDPNALARNGRPVSDWVSALRASLNAETFRSAALVPEELWKMIVSPEATAEARAAAAVVLAPSLDDAGKERLRVAASTTASPQLRVVLESAANGDDDKLTQALDELSPAEAAASVATSKVG